MFAAPSSSFSCGDNSIFPKFQHSQQPQLRHRLGLDQVATYSSFGLPHHPQGAASSFSSFSALDRSSSDGSFLPLHQHSFQVTHVQSPSYALACAGYGAGNGNLLQQEQNHLCLTSTSTLSCFVGRDGLSQLQQKCSRLQAHSKQHLSLRDQQKGLLQRQQKQELTKQHLSEILESIAEYQGSLKEAALASTNSQIDPNACGYLPPEFDISSCRSVFVGNLHHRVTLEFFGEVFSTVGTLAGSKLIRKTKSSYGIVEYSDHRAAAMAIATLNGRQLFGLPIKVNWAYLKDQKEDKTGHHTIFVGDLGAEIRDAALYALFKTYPSCSDVRVMWNPRSGQSKGYGFVSFKVRKDAEKAIKEMTGKMLGSRAIRCNWATEMEGSIEGHIATLKKGPENDSRFTTIYVGNLAQEVTEEELQKEFETLGVGVIENVRILKERNFGFVKYSNHKGAANAISAANGKIIGGNPVVCSWGTKRNPPEPPSEPRPLAAPVLPVEKVLPVNR